MANTLSFDEAYYLSQNPDVAAAVSRGIFTSGAQHFQLNGRFEGRNPNAFFNTSFYLGQYPDVAKAGINPLTHFLTFGVLENRATNAAELTAIDKDGNGVLNEFDAAAYLTANKDVADAIKAGTITSAYQHFIQFGQFEGRAAPLTNGSSVTGPFGNAGAGGSTFNLTTGVDNLVGTTGNDTFNATNTSASPVLGGLDKIDGGAGIDTLNIADTATATGSAFLLPAGFTMSNVEKLAVTTNGSIGTTATVFDVSTISGLTGFTGIAAGTIASSVKAAGTTDVNLTVAGSSTATIAGGKAVSVTAGTGATSVTGNALTSVTINGGGAATIDNVGTDAAATTAKGTTLASVTLNNVNADSAIKGEGLTSVSVSGATTAARTITVTNAKADHTVTLNAIGTGFQADGTTAATTTFVDAAAKTITVNATGAKSNVALTGSTAATTVNVTGTADLTLASLASATKLDGSAATGSLTLGDINAATVAVSTGSGNDTLAIQATAVTTVSTGAGNDIVTLKSLIAAGSTINLGAGNDKLLSLGGSVATSTASAVTVIDGGDGVDSVSASLINAANAAQFKNFEKLDISAAATLDAQLMTGSTLTGLTLSGDAGANSTVTNVAAGVGLEVSGANTGSHTIGVVNAATGTADSFVVTFAGTAASTATAAAPTSVTAGTLVANGIETLSVNSTGTGFVSNTMTVTDNALQTVSITGDKALSLAFTGTNGVTPTSATDTVNGVKLIDASNATGVITLDTTNLTVANAGLTVKTGAGNDIITLAQKATIDAGAGNDTITSSATGGTFTGGLGNDKFDISLAATTNTTKTEATGVIKSTITDFSAGDKIVFDTTSASFVSTKVALDSSVTSLDGALALASNNTVAGQINWVQYAGNTYLVENTDATAGIGATDLVVKLTGLVDLSKSTFAAASHDLSFGQ